MNSIDDDQRAETESGVVDRQTLSDLFVNAVPILIMAVLLVGFTVLTPGSSEPLLAMHLALVGGVVLVSYVAARAIASADGPLRGPNADSENDGDEQ